MRLGIYLRLPLLLLLRAPALGRRGVAPAFFFTSLQTQDVDAGRRCGCRRRGTRLSRRCSHRWILTVVASSHGFDGRPSLADRMAYWRHRRIRRQHSVEPVLILPGPLPGPPRLVFAKEMVERTDASSHGVGVGDGGGDVSLGQGDSFHQVFSQRQMTCNRRGQRASRTMRRS